MVIRNNLSAVNTSRLTAINERNMDGAMARLSSGNRITKASDDPSGLAVSEKMDSQVRGLNRASKNITDASAFIQTVEGYLNETQDILGRIREIAIQSGNGIYTDSDRMQVQVEVSQLLSEMDRVASHASFNGFSFLTGGFADGVGSVRFHVGANANQAIEASIGDMSLQGMGLLDATGGYNISMSTAIQANTSLDLVDQAIQKISAQRADLGAYQSRMEYMVDGVDIASQNLLAAKSNISDANMAEEMVMYSRDAILGQTSIAMLAQANQKNQSVLRLLG